MGLPFPLELQAVARSGRQAAKAIGIEARRAETRLRGLVLARKPDPQGIAQSTTLTPRISRARSVPHDVYKFWPFYRTLSRHPVACTGHDVSLNQLRLVHLAAPHDHLNDDAAFF